MARKQIGIGILLLFSAGSSRAQTEFDQIQVRAERVAGTVHVLYGGGGNIGVSVGPDGILLVDDQYAPLAPKIRAALRTNAGDRPVKFVLGVAVARGARYRILGTLAVYYGDAAIELMKTHGPVVGLSIAALIVTAAVAWFLWRRRTPHA